MEILVIREPIDPKTLQELADAWHKVLVKGVADIEQNVIALGGEWHMDANNCLIAEGSRQEHLWGFNIYPDKTGADALEFISLINIRPTAGNRSMEITDKGIRTAIRRAATRVLPFLGL